VWWWRVRESESRNESDESTPVDGDEPVVDDVEGLSAPDGTGVAGAGSSRNMFQPTDADERAVAQASRKRAALWGFATGIVMLVIAALCLVLAILATNSVS
jgi:hypothetical protein